MNIKHLVTQGLKYTDGSVTIVIATDCIIEIMTPEKIAIATEYHNRDSRHTHNLISIQLSNAIFSVISE